MAATQDVTIGHVPAYHAAPGDGKKHPGLIVIHEIWGLDEHIRNVTDRFAAQGYSVIAPNLFHGMSFDGKIDNSLLDAMKNPATKDEAQKTLRAAMAPIMAPEFAEDAVANLKLCADFLEQEPNTTDKIGVVGYCFGGSYAFHLAAKDPRIDAIVPYYGQPPTPEEVPSITCPVLAFYGDQDEPLMKSLPELKTAMKSKEFEAVVYPNAAHAFFNDTNKTRYNAAAARDSWTRAIKFLNLALKGN